MVWLEASENLVVLSDDSTIPIIDLKTLEVKRFLKKEENSRAVGCELAVHGSKMGNL
jgi:hypothetical protein